MNNIKFILYNEHVDENFYPLPAKKVIPDWYKNLKKYPYPKEIATSAKQLLDSKSYTVPLTVKNCTPVLDYLTGGYIIRQHADVFISQEDPENKTKNPHWYWWTPTGDNKEISFHIFEQMPIELNGKQNVYLKFNQPWGIKTPKGYSCLFYQPEFFFEKRFRLLPAIVDTDRYHNPVNFPGIITSTDKDFTIEAGTPLMVVFPFKREDWKLEIVSLKENILKKSVAEHWYQRFFHSDKTYE